MAATNVEEPAGVPLYGLTIPLNSIPSDSWHWYNDKSRERFANAISDWLGTPLMLRERKMMSTIGQLTDKPEWTRKIFDEEIVAKWKKEAIESSEDDPPEKQFSEKMFDYCVEEMRDYVKQQEEVGFIPAIDATAIVYKSDSIIPDELKMDLRAAAFLLEDIPESDKDWHPNSGEIVLDLVHPSLFPLLYGRSRVLKPEYGHVLGDQGEWKDKGGIMSLDDCEEWIGKGGIMPVPEKEACQVEKWAGLSSFGRGLRSSEQHFYSSRFQWLPCEVRFTDNDAVKITSYINNLQPKKHKPLYEALERVIAKVIPMWNATLSSMDYKYQKEPRIDINHIPWIEPEGERERGENEDEDEVYELDDEWIRENRKLDPPEPKDPAARKASIEPPNLKAEPIDLRKDFADRGLQVIVKLANIHLTPSKPKYDGGSWHIEGMLNEHITASALYYYDSDNITDSYLAFREATDSEWLSMKPYDQGDHDHFELLYDIQPVQGPAVQELGAVLTREGRVLTFPNVLQHRVSPFSLADPTRPGHRKILALFLVDPYTRIPSTANVPPQQKEWWKEMVHGLDRVGGLPVELREWVTDSTNGFPIDLDEAKRLRLELMDERRMFVKDHEQRLEEEEFHFCEH